MDDRSLHYRTCPLCEATCGLEVTVEGDSVVRIRGDRDDVFSHGFGLLGTVDECAALCCAYLDGTCVFVTGQFVAHDGGWS